MAYIVNGNMYIFEVDVTALVSITIFVTLDAAREAILLCISNPYPPNYIVICIACGKYAISVSCFLYNFLPKWIVGYHATPQRLNALRTSLQVFDKPAPSSDSMLVFGLSHPQEIPPSLYEVSPSARAVALLYFVIVSCIQADEIA